VLDAEAQLQVKHLALRNPDVIFVRCCVDDLAVRDSPYLCFSSMFVMPLALRQPGLNTLVNYEATHFQISTTRGCL
jgi:hypothetical protein